MMTAVFLPSLSISINVPLKKLSCLVCQCLLGDDFTSYNCGHHVCPVCLNGSMHSCTTPQVVPNDPVMMAVLQYVTRKLPCGVVTNTLCGYKTHISSCFKCLSVSYNFNVSRLKGVNEALIKECATLKRKHADLEKTAKTHLKAFEAQTAKNIKLNAARVTDASTIKKLRAQLREADTETDSDYNES